jgi:hypothetical protein
MKLARTGISLIDTESMEALGGRPSSGMRRQELPTGRGYLLKNGKLSSIFQVGYPDQPFYQYVLNKYKSTVKAKWQHPASSEMIDKVVIQKAVSDSPDEDGFFDVPIDQLAETYRKLRLQEMGQG